MSKASMTPGAKLLSKARQSAEVLRKQGLFRFLELSSLSLIEPLRSAKLRQAVSADAKRTMAKLGSGGRGLFVDCGSNVGQGYRFFSTYYKPAFYDYVLVEPNSNCLPHLQALRKDQSANIEIIDKAASVKNGHAKLFGPPASVRDPTYEGCSIVADHNNALYEAEEIKVDLLETFSLADLIMSKRSSYAAIVMKMDVEGAEYDILEDLIGKGVHCELDALYVEFHSQYMTGDERAQKRSAEVKFRNQFASDRIVFRQWI